MNDQLRDIFVECVKKTFRFLIIEHGFRGPEQLSVGGSVSATYYGQRIAIQASLDCRDGDIEVYLLWLMDGKLPDGWNVASDGKVRRVNLVRVLVERTRNWQSLQGKEHPRRGGVDWYVAENFERILSRHASLLQTHGLDFLSDSEEYFRSRNEQRPSKPKRLP